MTATTHEQPPVPSPRGETERASIREALRHESLTVRALSARVGLPERAIALHLAHVARSARARGKTLQVEPARCLRCGFSFATRSRLTTPSRCPTCRSERVDPPRFHLVAE